MKFEMKEVGSPGLTKESVPELAVGTVVKFDDGVVGVVFHDAQQHMNRLLILNKGMEWFTAHEYPEYFGNARVEGFVTELKITLADLKTTRIRGDAQ